MGAASEIDFGCRGGRGDVLRRYVQDVKDEVGVGKGFVGAGDAVLFGLVYTFAGGCGAEACGVDETDRDAVERERLFECVARGACDRRDDGAVAFEETVEEGAFAGVGAASDGDGRSVAQELAALEGGSEGFEWRANSGDEVGDLRGWNDVDVVELAGGEVHAGFEQGDEVKESFLCGSDAAGERPAELLSGDPSLMEGLGGDEVVDSFGLGEVDAAGEEGSLGKLAGVGEADGETEPFAGGEDIAKECVEDDRRAVSGDFDERVARIAVGSVKGGDEAVVEGAGGVSGVENAGKAGVCVGCGGVEWLG